LSDIEAEISLPAVSVGDAAAKDRSLVGGSAQVRQACCEDIEDLHHLLSAEALAQLDRLEQGARVCSGVVGDMVDLSGDDDWARLDEDDWARLDELERKASQPTVTVIAGDSSSSSSALTTLRQALLCAAFIVEAVEESTGSSSSTCRVKVLSCKVKVPKRSAARNGEVVTIELSGEWSVTIELHAVML
jgi:hypothetical protein